MPIGRPYGPPRNIAPCILLALRRPHRFLGLVNGRSWTFSVACGLLHPRIRFPCRKGPLRLAGAGTFPIDSELRCLAPAPLSLDRSRTKRAKLGGCAQAFACRLRQGARSLRLSLSVLDQLAHHDHCEHVRIREIGGLRHLPTGVARHVTVPAWNVKEPRMRRPSFVVPQTWRVVISPPSR
jgi:hypothetical protein